MSTATYVHYVDPASSYVRMYDSAYYVVHLAVSSLLLELSYAITIIRTVVGVSLVL